MGSHCHNSEYSLAEGKIMTTKWGKPGFAILLALTAATAAWAGNIFDSGGTNPTVLNAPPGPHAVRIVACGGGGGAGGGGSDTGGAEASSGGGGGGAGALPFELIAPAALKQRVIWRIGTGGSGGQGGDFGPRVSNGGEGQPGTITVVALLQPNADPTQCSV